MGPGHWPSGVRSDHAVGRSDGDVHETAGRAGAYDRHHGRRKERHRLFSGLKMKAVKTAETPG
jgi:hypothetical protein